MAKKRHDRVVFFTKAEDEFLLNYFKDKAEVCHLDEFHQIETVMRIIGFSTYSINKIKEDCDINSMIYFEKNKGRQQ